MICPSCGPLDYHEVLIEPDTEVAFCALCGEDLPEQDPGPAKFSADAPVRPSEPRSDAGGAGA